MKVKCVRLLNVDGKEVEFSPWLTLGKIYHVMTIYIDENGHKSYGIIASHPKGEWPQIVNNQEECFEVVSELIPSNWQKWQFNDAWGMSPAAWQENNFYEKFYDHEPSVYPIYERERNVILREDP
jgi:hypothetical protein